MTILDLMILLFKWLGGLALFLVLIHAIFKGPENTND